MFKKYSLITLLFAFILMISPVYSQNSSNDLIKPVNANQFEKEVEDGLTCYGDSCYQQDTVKYSKGNDIMSINSEELINKYGTEITRKNLPDFKAFLNHEKDADLVDLRFIFDDNIDCGIEYLGDLDQVKYPGMDKMRAIYTFDTQCSWGGNFYIRVFAQKGDQYIMLKTMSPLCTEDKDSYPSIKFQECLDKSNAQGDPTEDPSFRKCYREGIQGNAKIQGMLSRQAQNLIDTFAIE